MAARPFLAVAVLENGCYAAVLSELSISWAMLRAASFAQDRFAMSVCEPSGRSTRHMLGYLLSGTTCSRGLRPRGSAYPVAVGRQVNWSELYILMLSPVAMATQSPADLPPRRSRLVGAVKAETADLNASLGLHSNGPPEETA